MDIMPSIPTLKQKFHALFSGELTELFLNSLKWSLSSAVFSKIISGVTTILAARYLGPKEFGEANLSLASTYWIQIPLYFGITAAIAHYVPQAEEKEKETWISDGYKLFFFYGLFTFVTAFVFRSYWAKLLGISEVYLLMGLVWCMGSWLDTGLKTFLAATSNFRTRALLEVFTAILFPVFFFIGMRMEYRSAAYLLSLALASGLAGTIGFLFYRPKINLQLHLSPQLKRLLTYGLLAAMGSLTFALFESSNRIVTNKYLSVDHVGLIAAFNGGSNQIAFFLLAAFSPAFFSFSSKSKNKKSIFDRANFLLFSTIPVSILLFCGVLLTYLFLLGKNYPFTLLQVFVFSTGASLLFVNGSINWFLMSLGRRGLVLFGITGVISGTLNLLLCRLLIPSHEILGAGYAYVISTAFNIFLTELALHKKLGLSLE